MNQLIEKDALNKAIFDSAQLILNNLWEFQKEYTDGRFFNVVRQDQHLLKAGVVRAVADFVDTHHADPQTLCAAVEMSLSGPEGMMMGNWDSRMYKWPEYEQLKNRRENSVPRVSREDIPSMAQHVIGALMDEVGMYLQALQPSIPVSTATNDASALEVAAKHANDTVSVEPLGMTSLRAKGIEQETSPQRLTV